VTELHYDPVTPIDLVFNKVEDLVEYGELAHNPYSQLQTITKAYNILNATGTFKDGIKTWNRIIDPLQKTWINFKVHFRTTHKELSETGDLTLRQAGYHQANIFDEIVTRLQAEQTTRDDTQMEETLQHLLANAAIPSPPVTADPMMPQLLAQMQAMMTAMQQQTQQQTQQQSTATNSSRERTRTRASLTGPRPGQPPNPLPAWINKYCWTHGCCNHHGRVCRDKAPGHKDDATKAVKLGGSEWGCI
jgi:hypothetical protein